VALSVVIATLASYVALDMAGRTAAARGRARGAWLAAGSAAMGVGIWAMHFVGMLAFRLHAPDGATSLMVAYDAPLLVLSVLVAVGASALALGVARRETLDASELAGAALLLGGAIAGMHYLGMAAMRMPATLGYDPALVGASLGIACVASYAALWLARRLGNVSSHQERLAKGAAAAVMGVAIAGMHYTGMAAAHFAATAHTSAHPGGDVVATAGLAGIIAIGAVLVLLVALLGAAMDRGHHAALDETLRHSEARFRQVVERSPECIVVHSHGTVLFVNPASAELFGVPSAEDLVGRELIALLHPDSREEMRERLAQAEVTGPRAQSGAFKVMTADGRVREVETTSVLVEHDGQPALQTHVRDVTTQKALERQLVHETLHDPLTGLANRVLFRERVEHALARATRWGPRPVVLFLDLDNFKRVNDGWGHVAGDRLLVQVATRLQATLRDVDTCARLGGDEFAVLLESTEGGAASIETRAAHAAERIVASLTEPVMCDGVAIEVGVSVGIAAATPADGADELLRNADLAMYRAKAAGKGRYEVFEPTMHAAVRERLEMEADLRRVVANGCRDLEVHYQPIASLGDRRLIGFEALARWRDEKRGLVAPLTFIPLAEETGLIVAIGRHVLETACRQARAWHERLGRPVSITVNLSARQLAEPELTATVAEALAESGVAPAALVLEMTESMLIDDSEVTLARLRALKALGVRLAIDDFGTGFSSLAYLERFPVDLLKIDKRFVDNVGVEHDESPLARAILGLGATLGMRVVAEGIETEAQWSRLRELGCELGQGFYVAAPQPAEDVQWLLDAELADAGSV
jgi:diguanylate cyclase (GGDEF)-like protein/PAS domain S-box-containing protein